MRGINKVTRIIVASALVFIATSQSGSGQESQSVKVEKYAIPRHGTLHLAVPVTWIVTSASARDRPKLVDLLLRIEPKGTKRFRLMVNAIRFPGGPGPQPDRALVVEDANKALPSATAPPIIEELKGDSAAGFYYTYARKDPKDQNFSHYSGGILHTGELIVNFGLLYSDSNDQTAVLDMLKGSKHVR